MKYSKIEKYKYRLEEDEVFHTSLFGYSILNDMFELRVDGRLIVFKGYLWDGVSGPTWDSDNTMRAGLAHDVKYQMIRLCLLPLHEKGLIDKEFKYDLLNAGMVKFRAEYYYQAVKLFGHSSCIPGNIKIPKIIYTKEHNNG